MKITKTSLAPKGEGPVFTLSLYLGTGGLTVCHILRRSIHHPPKGPQKQDMPGIIPPMDYFNKLIVVYLTNTR